MPVTFVAQYLSISRTGSHCRGHGRQLLRLRFDRKSRKRNDDRIHVAASLRELPFKMGWNSTDVSSALFTARRKTSGRA